MRRATQTRSGEAAGLQDSKAKGDVPPSCASRLPPFNIRRPTPCRNKYAVNTAQLPAFLPMSAAIRALNVGRSMLLLRSRASPGEGPAATGLAALHFLPCCRGCPRSLLHPHLFSIASTTEALSTVDNRAVADILDSLRVGFSLAALYEDLAELVLAQQAVLAAIARALIDLDLDRRAADG